VALCLSILLYGSEVWSLREDLLSRLRSFHHRCVRTMCRINIAHTIRHHISTNSLLVRLGIEPLETYYHRRLLRWAGHVSRMPLNRLPRMLLTGWVANPRPLGCPQMTWVGRLKRPSAARAYRPTSRLGTTLPPTDARGDKSVGLWGVSWSDTKRHQGQAGNLGGAQEWPQESLTRTSTNSETS
jgi:hypothetical protein